MKCNSLMLTSRLCNNNYMCTDVMKILEKPFKHQQRILNVLECFCMPAETYKSSHTIYYIP